MNVSGVTTLNNITTLNSSLNVSGSTIFNNATTCISSLNVSGTTTLSNSTTLVSSFNVSGITNLNSGNVAGTLSFGSRVEDYLIKLYGNDYGFGINGSTLRYNAPSGASHKFYIGTTEKTNISSSGLQVKGIANITNTSPYATANNYMQAGSLTIGDVLLDYGGGNNWTANTAGLMLECANNTEIAVHDSGARLASLMYYEGATNKITIGRDMGWGTISSVVINGALVAPTQVRSPLLTATQNSRGYASNIYGTAFNGWYIDLNTFWSGNAGNGGPAYLTLCFCFSQNTNIKWYGRVMVNSGGGTFGLITDLKNPTSGPTMINISNEWGTNGQNFLYISQAVMDNTYTLIYKIIG